MTGRNTRGKRRRGVTVTNLSERRPSSYQLRPGSHDWESSINRLIGRQGAKGGGGGEKGSGHKRATTQNVGTLVSPARGGLKWSRKQTNLRLPSLVHGGVEDDMIQKRYDGK